MISIEEIKKPIEAEFNTFQERFRQAFENENELINTVNSYILNKTGKQIRPILTLLSAESVGNINDDTIKCAISLEMLHTASLIHDDVVDESDERRGQKSVNAIWNNKVSILIGDYLLSKSMAIANETKSHPIINKIANLGKELSEGELMQINNVKKINIEEKKYFDVIKKKTAALFNTCTYTGAITTNCTEEDANKLKNFGEIYGICFQIKDDIFDYIASEKKIGKPVGKDIREGKITLPLLYALNVAKERETYLDILQKKNFSDDNILKIIDFTIKNKGIKYAESKIEEYIKKGEEIIETMSKEKIRNSLRLLLHHTIEREK